MFQWLHECGVRSKAVVDIIRLHVMLAHKTLFFVYRQKWMFTAIPSRTMHMVNFDFLMHDCI